MRIPEDRWAGFRTALYQFIMPLVDAFPDGTKARLYEPSFLCNPDLTILASLDRPLPENFEQAPRPSLKKTPRMCKNIGKVTRPDLRSPTATATATTTATTTTTTASCKVTGSTKKRKRTARKAGDATSSRSRGQKTKYFDQLKKKREC